MTARRADGPPTVLPFFLNAELQLLGNLGTLALGAHWRLTYWAWGRGGIGPEDKDELLARIVRLRATQWPGVRLELLTVWRVEDGVWVHDGLAEAVAVANSKRASNSTNGGKGGRAKALKYKGDGVANANLSASGRHGDGVAKSCPRVQRDNLSAPYRAERDYPLPDASSDELWDRVKGGMPSNQRAKWLDPLDFICLDQGAVLLGAPNRFIADWVRDRLSDELRRRFAAEGVPVQAVVVNVGAGVEIAMAHQD